MKTTRQLIKQGAHVAMAFRRVDAAEGIAKSFEGLQGSYEIIRCNLVDLQSIRDFVEVFLNKHDHLDGLSSNAGLVNMNNVPDYTSDGLESTIAVSYLDHFLLTE